MKISLPVFKVNIYCIYINILELSRGKVHLNDGLVFLEEAHCPAVRVKNVSLLNHKIITSPGKNETIEGERERQRDKLCFHIWTLYKGRETFTGVLTAPTTPGSMLPPESSCPIWLLSSVHILHVSNARA